MNNNSLPLVMYGAGKRAVKEIDRVTRNGWKPICFCDADVKKQNKVYLGLPVYSLEQIQEKYGKFYLYVTPDIDIRYEIFDYLLERGISKDRIVNYDENKTLWAQVNGIISPHQFLLCSKALSEWPNAETLGNLILSIPELQGDNSNLEDIRMIACGSIAQNFLDTLLDDLNSDSLYKTCDVCLDYLHAISIKVKSGIDQEFLCSLLSKICVCCFPERDAQVVFVWMLFSEDIRFSQLSRTVAKELV